MTDKEMLEWIESHLESLYPDFDMGFLMVYLDLSGEPAEVYGKSLKECIEKAAKKC